MSLKKTLKIGAIIVQYILVFIALKLLYQWSQGIEVATVNLPYLLLAIISIILFRLGGVYRLHRLLQGVSSLPKRTLLSIQLLSVSLGLLTPAKMGESVKILLLSKETESRKKIGTIFLFEKILDVLVFLPLTFVFIILNRSYAYYFLILAAVLAVAVIVYLKIKKKVPLPRRIVRADTISYTLVLFFFQIISFWFIALASGVPLSLSQAGVIWSVAGVITILSAFPGGLGAREVSLAFLLVLLTGIESSQAAGISLLHTLVNYGTTWTMAFLAWASQKLLRTPDDSVIVR